MRVPFVSIDEHSTSLMPRLALTLRSDSEREIEVMGLLDTGSTVNVLPYSAGIALGANWDSQPVIPSLAGNLAAVEVRAIDAWALHPDLTSAKSVRLVFAWAETDDVPVIFGQMNFFMEFNVCFYRSNGFFEVTTKP